MDSEHQVLLPTLKTKEGTSDTQLEIDASRGEHLILTIRTTRAPCSVCGCLAAARCWCSGFNQVERLGNISVVYSELGGTTGHPAFTTTDKFICSSRTFVLISLFEVFL